MRDLTAAETVEQVVRSLKDNNVQFERERRINSRARKYAMSIVVFLAGIASGIFGIRFFAPIAGFIKSLTH